MTYYAPSFLLASVWIDNENPWKRGQWRVSFRPGGSFMTSRQIQPLAQCRSVPTSRVQFAASRPFFSSPRRSFGFFPLPSMITPLFPLDNVVVTISPDFIKISSNRRCNKSRDFRPEPKVSASNFYLFLQMLVVWANFSLPNRLVLFTIKHLCKFHSNGNTTTLQSLYHEKIKGNRPLYATLYSLYSHLFLY